ncbi:UDP-glycosyltransferase 87A1 isoform X1 [Eucalyptus grandis]|uniref:UDP-glycosyltransferase 87A1 isoform X1 n=1 Tax=Eucalyptus grandis TaxID=71139 RepID=UPI00192EA7BC|nr:UDP-glycosyltransferase 87A1 isoform X1 [Eucalyptus grandis]
MDRQASTCHMVAMPYPGRGHINPMMNLCKILASRAPHVTVTLVLTEEWLGLVGSDSKLSNVSFATIPNVLPSERVRAQHFSEFVEAVSTKMEAPFKEVLDRLCPPPTLIVADTFLTWAVHVGNQRNIPVASFWTTAASNFSFLYQLQLHEQNGHLPQNLSGDEKEDSAPEIPQTRSPLLVDGSVMQKVRLMLNWVPRAQYLLLSSVYEFESQTVHALKPSLSFPIYTIGPSIPYFELEGNPRSNSDSNYILNWLDRQPGSSVLYLSLGSFLSVSSSKMDEIAVGLRDSNVRFLWVALHEASRLKELLPDGDMGIVVPWCDQLRALTHPSVGGFWTHCGWNSIQEGVYAGLPFLAYPIAMDQGLNCKLVVDDWKVGWRVGEGEGDIAGLVRKFMDSGDDESRELRRRVEGLRELCRHAIGPDGSSGTNIGPSLATFRAMLQKFMTLVVSTSIVQSLVEHCLLLFAGNFVRVKAYCTSITPLNFASLMILAIECFCPVYQFQPP